jgi:hypothetical protein
MYLHATEKQKNFQKMRLCQLVLLESICFSTALKQSFIMSCLKTVVSSLMFTLYTP